MIKIENVTKKYGKILAVDDVSFEVKKGSILGFLGPNGAGKSTIMNMVTGYLSATSGKIYVDGIDTSEKSIEARRKIGYLPELPPLYGDMTVKEYLNFICELKGVSANQRKDQMDNVMYITKIGDKRDRLVRNLSKGYRQRVGFAQAMLGDPEILILDEPTVGLDPSQVVEFRKIINALGRSHTIVLSTHILQEVSAVCSDVVIINGGKIVRDCPLSEFTTTENGEKRLFVTFEGTKEEAAELLKTVPGIKYSQFSRVERDAVVFRTVSAGGTDINKAIFQAAAAKNLPILEMKSVEKTLEEEYMHIVCIDHTAKGEDENGSDI